MNRRLTAVSFSLAAFTAVGFTVIASDARIETWVDARVRAPVAAIADSLEREGIKPEPLVDYALEGTRKRGNPDVILAGVRKWARDLRRARHLLGPNASAAEINAGAKALRAGIDERQLERLRDGKSEQRYASALSTMSYLIAKGVPAETASTVLVNIALASASEAQIRTLQDEIERDINGGTPPGLATVARAGGLLEAHPAVPSACWSFATTSPVVIVVESVTCCAAATVAVSVDTFAGSDASAPAGAATRTKIARVSPTLSVTEDVPHTSGVSVAGSKVPFALASMKALEVQPWAERESARHPAAKLAVSTPLPLLVSVCV